MSNAANIDPLIPAADTGPQPYDVVRFNALKYGILSRYTVFSHESRADYGSLVNSLMDEHLPVGATEQHLIEELASAIWRENRVPGCKLRSGRSFTATNRTRIASFNLLWPCLSS